MQKKRVHGGLTVLGLAGLLFLGLAALPSAEDPPRFSEWTAPVNLGPVINSTYTEAGTFISRNGLSLYFGSTRPGGVGAANTFDIWVSHRASIGEAWGPPENLGAPVNSADNEQTPALSIDGHRLFFARDGVGGYGSQDLYVSRRQNAWDDFDYRDPANLGPGVNTSAEESGPTVIEDETTGILTIYFSSTRTSGLGSEDIYVATAYPDEPFGVAVIEPLLSGPYRDVRPFLLRGGLELFFDSNRPGSIGSNVDLWRSRRESVQDSWSEPVRLPDYLNSAGVDARPVVSFDGTELYFHSNRPGSLGRARHLRLHADENQGADQLGTVAHCPARRRFPHIRRYQRRHPNLPTRSSRTAVGRYS